MSNIFNYLILQLFDVSSMSDILNHLIIHLSDVLVANYFASIDYSTIQFRTGWLYNTLYNPDPKWLGTFLVEFLHVY
jgi:hypothetical protein